MAGIQEQLLQYRAERRRLDALRKEQASQEAPSVEPEPIPITRTNTFGDARIHTLDTINNSDEVWEDDSLFEAGDGAKLIPSVGPDEAEEQAFRLQLHTIAKWLVGCILWMVAYYYFLSIQFGAVFFALSLLVGIYWNTRTRPKMQGELSAYSVFNENCEAIDGTVNADQLQKEMMFGPLGLM